jgi:hypothetical protein
MRMMRAAMSLIRLAGRVIQYGDGSPGVSRFPRAFFGDDR